MHCESSRDDFFSLSINDGPCRQFVSLSPLRYTSILYEQVCHYAIKDISVKQMSKGFGYYVPWLHAKFIVLSGI